MPQGALILLLACVALARSASAQVNDGPRNNGEEAAFFYSDPSLGATVGAVPPDAQGDLYWMVHTGEDQLAYVGPDGAAQMEIAGYYEWLYDTDWSTTPPFYTRTHGPALPGPSGTLEPAFFQLGFTSEVTVVIGPSGFGDPCAIAPSLCSAAWCPPTLGGWIVDMRFELLPGSGPVVSSEGTSASDLATTWFLPGGMTLAGGTCGMGDYAVQDIHSTDETAADLLGTGLNPWGGFQIAGGGPIAESLSSTVAGWVTWKNPVLNPIADSGTGLGLEAGQNGGGAQNGYLLGVSGGGARLAVELRDELGAAVAGNLAFVGASLAPLAVPGAAFLGAQVLVQPDPLFAITVRAWQGSVTPAVFLFTQEGTFRSAPLDVPPALAGTALYLQGLTLDPATLGARTTNRVRVRLF
jgi:hypothetical protein